MIRSGRDHSTPQRACAARACAHAPPRMRGGPTGSPTMSRVAGHRVGEEMRASTAAPAQPAVGRPSSRHRRRHRRRERAAGPAIERRRSGLSTVRRRLPRLPRDGRAPPRRRRRAPGHRAGLHHRPDVRATAHLGGRGLRPPGSGRGRARGHVRRPPPRPRAPLGRDAAVHPAAARDPLRRGHGTRAPGHPHRRHPAYLDHLHGQPGWAPVRPGWQPVPRPGARTVSRTRARRRSGPTSTATTTTHGRARLSAIVGELSRSPALLGAGDPGGARLRPQPRRRWSPAHPDPHHASTPRASRSCGPTATPIGTCRPT